VHTELRSQARQAARAPALIDTAGQFRAAEVSREPVIDGQEWVATKVQTLSAAGRVPLPTQDFSLTATNCGDHSGDFERCELLFQRGHEIPIRIDRDFTGWVYVTPDARFVFTEPLYVLDVRSWKQYALFDGLGIQNYVSIDAISRDGRRLFISRVECPADCPDERRRFYEVVLPK